MSYINNELYKKIENITKLLKHLIDNPLCILNNANFNIIDISIKYKLVDIPNSC